MGFGQTICLRITRDLLSLIYSEILQKRLQIPSHGDVTRGCNETGEGVSCILCVRVREYRTRRTGGPSVETPMFKPEYVTTHTVYSTDIHTRLITVITHLFVYLFTLTRGDYIFGRRRSLDSSIKLELSLRLPIPPSHCVSEGRKGVFDRKG